ncbi:MAG: hypothetical protein WCR52_09365 [Bacteroidota bacterium]
MKFLFCTAYFSALCCIASPVYSQQQAPTPPPHIRLPAVLKEVSGMVRLPSGDLWLLNDSGNPPLLFRFDPLAGKILETKRLPIPNRDWEDLTCDPKGIIYIGDFGNNRNNRKDLRIYQYNPSSGAMDSILFNYPDQKAFPPANLRDWNFNCEAMVFLNDSLHIFSKNNFKGNGFSKHYVLPARPGTYTAELRDSFQFKNRVITGAGLSADGKQVALTSYIIGTRFGFIPYTKCSIFYLTDFKGSNFFGGNIKRKKLRKFLIAKQYESVTQWNEQCWLVANEGRGPQFQAIWRVKKKG